MQTFACNTAFGQGGIGQHFAQLVEEARAEGRLERYYAPGIAPDDDKGQHFENSPWLPWLRRYTPIRFSPSWRTYVTGEFFDWRLARHLSRVSRCFVGFAGTSLRCFRKARKRGADQCVLVAPNSHVNNVARLHRKARKQTGIKDTWLNGFLRRKMIKEYTAADVICVHSTYVRQSFLDEGVPEHKLQWTTLNVDPRFVPPKERPDDGVFRVMYCGRVDATKGIPLLIDAFTQLSGPAELTLVGGWSTRTMRKYMQRQMAQDERIRCAPGDPLPHLHRADVFVHPTFEEGFGYAPMEALACGVPAIVTEDTGMKEHIAEGKNGFIVPTGSVEALVERMKEVRRHPMTRTRSAEDVLREEAA